MHVGHKPLFTYAPHPQPTRNPDSDETKTREFMRHSAALAEDLGEGGKKGNRMRGARQERRYRHAEDEEGAGDAADEPAGCPTTGAANRESSELPDLVAVPGSAVTQQEESSDPAPVKADPNEPTFDELLARALASS